MPWVSPWLVLFITVLLELKHHLTRKRGKCRNFMEPVEPIHREASKKNLATTFDPSNMYSPTRVKSAWIIYHFQDISWNIFVRLFQMMWKTCKRVWRILKGQLKVWLAATFINKSWLGICKFHGTPSMTQDEATSIISFFVLLWMKFNRRHYNNP